MTNIGAFKVTEKQSDNILKDYLVFVADGMGSIDRFDFDAEGRVKYNPSGGIKFDTHQKLYRIGNNLLMGTGRSDQISETAQRLSTSNFSSAKELADKVLEITSTYGLSEKDYLNFIVGGKDDDGLFVYQINTTGNFPDIGVRDYSRRGHFRGNAAFDGSGSGHVRNYLQGCDAAGKPLQAIDIADGLTLAYEFGKKGARDSGVNDKMQYGIISDNGVSTLYHPDIRLISAEAYHQYIGEMCGVSVPIPTRDTSKEDLKIIANKRNDLTTVLRNFYFALDLDLKDYSEMRTEYTTYAEEFANDLVPEELFTEVKNMRKQAKSNIVKGADALVKRGLISLLDYKSDFNHRQSEIEQRSLSYMQK